MADEKKLNISLDKVSSERSDKKKGFVFTKIKGSTSFAERLKAISKKDIAWLVIGVVILIMAPIAEYFISKPKTNTALTSGFGERRMVDSGGIYEPGINALSAGSPDGMEEVIAPLTARDPASLILGAKKESPQLPSPPPPQQSNRDSVADIAKKSLPEAVKSSPAPFIPPKMQAMLRGLGAVSGGTMTGASLPKNQIISEAKNAPSKSQKKTIVGAQAVPNFKGVATISDSVNKGAFEKLRTQADKAADYFSGANAKEALENAAAASINPVGGGGFGALQDGGRGSGFSNSSIRDSRSYSPGDPCRGSLERELYCQQQRKKQDFDLWLKYDLPKEFIKQMTDSFVKPIGEKIASSTKALLNPGGPAKKSVCWKTATYFVPISGVELDKGGPDKLADLIRECPCGFAPEPSPACKQNNNQPGPSNGGGGQQQGGSTGGSAGAAPAPSAQPGNNTPKSELEKYDMYLKEAISAARAGLESTTVGQLKTQTSKAAQNIELAIASAQNITEEGVRLSDFVSKKIAEYKDEIDKLNTEVKSSREEYTAFYKDINLFESTLKKAINDYNSGKIKPELEKGVVAETLGGEDVVEKLKEALNEVGKIKQEAESLEKEELVRYEKTVRSHFAALEWYLSETKKVSDIDKSVYSQTGEHASKVKSLLSVISSIPDNTIQPPEVDRLKATFTQLTGKTPQNVVVAQPDGKGGNIPPSEIRNAVSDEDKMNEISILIKWRGANENKVWNELKIDDSEVLEKERSEFDSKKPSVKLSFAVNEPPTSFSPLSNVDNFIVPISRRTNISDDVDKSKKQASWMRMYGFAGFKTLLAVKEDNLKNLKAQLKPLLDQITSPQPAPTTPPEVQKPPTPSTSTVLQTPNQSQQQASKTKTNTKKKKPQSKPSESERINIIIINQVQSNANANSTSGIQVKKEVKK